jgi:hypothetical protein
MTEQPTPPTATAEPVPELEHVPAGGVLREFALSGGRWFQIVKDADADAVRIHRRHPQPDRGRNVAEASGLDGTRTVWRWPANWTPAERHHVTVTVANAWLAHHKAQQAARDVAEREAAEREAQAA